MTQIHSNEIAAAIAQATGEVFSTMLGLEAKPGPACEAAIDNHAARDGVQSAAGGRHQAEPVQSPAGVFPADEALPRVARRVQPADDG